MMKKNTQFVSADVLTAVLVKILVLFAMMWWELAVCRRQLRRKNVKQTVLVTEDSVFLECDVTEDSVLLVRDATEDSVLLECDVTEDSVLLECDAVSLSKYLPPFPKRRELLGQQLIVTFHSTFKSSAAPLWEPQSKQLPQFLSKV